MNQNVKFTRIVVTRYPLTPEDDCDFGTIGGVLKSFPLKSYQGLLKATAAFAHILATCSKTHEIIKFFVNEKSRGRPMLTLYF